MYLEKLNPNSNFFSDKKAPIFGLQWHPEKNLFIFNPNLAIDHSPLAIAAAQYIANTFMGFARQNPNRFPTRLSEEASLVFKHSPLYVGNITETPYEQIYVFPLFKENLSKMKIKQSDKT